MLNFLVNAERCGHCGLCVKDCPSRIIGQGSDGVPFIAEEQEAFCIQCQHCLAICPSAAISIFGHKPENSLQITTEGLPQLDEVELLVRARRSVRKYRDKNVEPNLIQRLLAAVANAPTGVNARKLSFTVIDDKDVMQQFREKFMRILADGVSAGRIPDGVNYLRAAVPIYFEKGGDLILRGAPHLLIISAVPEAPCGTEDVNLSLAYFELLAQSAGLGTVWCGMFKLAAEILPEIKSLVGLTAGHPYYAMLFGYPAVRYARTVQRDDAANFRRIDLSSLS